MNKNIKLFTIIIFILVIIAIIIIFVVNKNTNEVRNQNIITTGISQNQGQYFNDQMTSAIAQEEYIQAGKRSFSEGDYNKAIDSFNRALSISKMTGEKGESMEHIADVYEKMRNYNEALKWMTNVKNNCPNKWAIKPFEERIAYLEHILIGDYESAMLHARKAIDEYSMIGNAQTDVYKARLNDLIAAKDYIESLKK